MDFKGLLGALLLAAPHLAAQTIQTFHSAVDDSEQPYALFVPKSLQPDRKYPLVISLHAEQSTHRTNLRQVFGIPLRLSENDRDDLRFPPNADAGYIVACPLARGTMGYQGIAEADVYEVLADVERRYPIDLDRVYLTGISMGGGGALRFALTRPDVWAAVAVVAPTAPQGVDELAPNLIHVPLRLFHGEQDPIVKPEVSRAWHRRLLEAGAPVEYIEYPGIRHNAWDRAYRNGALFEWFGKFRRNPAPERVRFVTKAYRYSRAYWVTIDSLTPGVAASIDARRTAQEIQVQTANVEGFTLSLDRPASLVTVDGAAVRVKAAATLSFEKVAGRWRAGRMQPAGKRAGAEGPISEALSGRQIYVYGTLGASGQEELASRQKVAATAAAWSSNRARLGLRFAVKADSAVSAADLETADVILFGSRETNSLIARFAPQFPMQLNPGAADYGLLFIAPIGKRYALVSSGLPWFSGAGEWEPGGDAFAPAAYRLLSAFGDYVLFKGSAGNLIAEGRFTTDWKVPPSAASRLLSTGTVTLH